MHCGSVLLVNTNNEAKTWRAYWYYRHMNRAKLVCTAKISAQRLVPYASSGGGRRLAEATCCVHTVHVGALA
jgi:hypothetical protein